MIIGATQELRRVLQLPRRVWTEDEGLGELVDYLTAAYKTPHGLMRLHAAQAMALGELSVYGGLFAPLAVGSGKTLVSLLASRAVSAVRPLLLIPAKLRGKTEAAIEAALEHWEFTPPKVLTYELLARDRGVTELEAYAPDLIIADEAHRLKNPRAACTRRVKRYLGTDPRIHYVDLSGTTVKRSINDYAQRLAWAVGPERYPLPVGWSERRDWALALDPQTPDHERPRPGGLLLFCDKGESLQEGYGRRLTETPGVISTPPRGGCAASIHIQKWDFPVCLAARRALKTLRELWELPNGETFCEAVDLWRHARSIACGFYYQPETPPPEAWSRARKAWHRFVRHTLAHRRSYDTELQVARACAAGVLPRAEHVAWVDIRDIYTPKRKAHWVCDCMLQKAARWASERKGIVWVEHVAFGEALAEASGLPYYHAQGLNASGESIEDARDSSIIASIAACAEGFNLQHYSDNLVTAPPASGTTWEQLIGRTHRYGQQADEIAISVALTLREQQAALKQSIKDAIYIQETTKQEQKLLLADIEGGDHEFFFRNQ